MSKSRYKSTILVDEERGLVDCDPEASIASIDSADE